MADDTQDEVVVSGNQGNQPVLPKPPSAWKVGLLFSLISGPLGGLAAGLIQRHRNKSYLEEESAAEYEKKSLGQTFTNELGIADDDEKRLLNYGNSLKTQAYERFAAGDRQGGQQLLNSSKEILESIMKGDIEDRKREDAAKSAFQRDLVGDAAKGMRQEFQNSIDAFNAIDHQSLKVLDLVADKNFDPNNPLNKAHLAELISMGGLMFKDTPDLAEGLAQGIGAVNGVAGGLAEGFAKMLKSEDFKVSPEMYNRIALNTQKYAKILAERKMSQLGAQGKQLDTWGKRLGVIPQDYSIGSYISGGETELRLTPNPVFTGGFKDTSEKVKDYFTAPTERLGTFRGRGASGSWGPATNRRPTND